MRSISRHSAPLPWRHLAVVIGGGALTTRGIYLLSDSADLAGVVGIAFLLALVVLQRRRAVTHPARVLFDPKQIGPRVIVVSLMALASIVAMTFFVQGEADSGWAAVFRFVGLALLAEWIVWTTSGEDDPSFASRTHS